MLLTGIAISYNKYFSSGWSRPRTVYARGLLLAEVFQLFGQLPERGTSRLLRPQTRTELQPRLPTAEQNMWICRLWPGVASYAALHELPYC